MAVELLVSAALPVLFEKLASSEFYSWAFDEGVRSKLVKWERKLEKIDAVLSSAEEKQLISRPVKLWLEDLQHLAYDVEDILEEFAYEASRHSSTPSCFKNFTRSAIKFDYTMRSRIEDITSRFEELYRERAELGLIHESSGGASATQLGPEARPPSSSVPGIPVHGREEDKKKILEMLSRDGNFSVIAIVGMGGLGKTTLAREVYNDKKLEDLKFEEKMWVSVSEDFDVFRISKSLLESINNSFSSLNTLDQVQKELKEAVRGRKVFIVLDDVWNENFSSWETLKCPFIEGAPGSRIIVTTRNQSVARIMGSSETYELERLSNEDCWRLFMKYAFEGKSPCAPVVTNSIHEKIVGKCGGLPLAAKTLGSLLYSMKIEEWENVLNSKIWDSSGVGGILPVLKLSYYHLPPHLKRCFSYCAIFPKDYEFEDETLGLLWMAEGLIQPSDQHLELTSKYFHELYSRSLFQKSTSDNSKYVMHDLVHDLAQSISGEVCFRLDEGANTKSPKTFEKTRHFSYIANEFSGKDFFKDLEKFKRLRTFLPVFKSTYGQNFLCAMVLFDVLPQLKKLRVLSLERYRITHLPDSIRDLMHLKYLNLSSTDIKYLPESTCSLLNLQTLLLKDCFCLMKLPSNMSYLTNLYHLDISGKNSLKEMPCGMRVLKNLRILSKFIVGKESSSNLEDLKSLNFLKGVLHVSKLENMNNVKQISGLILNNKKDLKELLLGWRPEFDGSRVERIEKDVLDMLKPHSNIEKLTIRSYGGSEFSSWLRTSSSFSKLMVLKLEDCKNCTSLPSQSLLSSLKELVIKEMPKLERIDMQSLFDELEILYFKSLQICQSWNTEGENKNVGRFPKLRQFSIIDCPKLIVKLHDHFPSLEVLVIEKCARLMVSFSSFPKLTTLRIDECAEVVPTSSSTNQLMSLKFDESLPNIADADSENWSSQNISCVEKPVKGSGSLTSLKSLYIRNCSSSFLNTIFLLNLSDLTIVRCWALNSLPERLKQNNIERLTIDMCHSLLFIERSTVPLSLKRLEISWCHNLQSLEDISCTPLEYLKIEFCISLTCLSSEGSLPNTLKKLEISYCTNLTTLSSSWCEHKKLEYLYIEDCPELKSIKEALDNSPCLKKIDLIHVKNLELSGLRNLTCLQELRIVFSSVSLPIEGIHTNLINLGIMGDEEMSKRLIRWGLHKFTSLKSLSISGFEESEITLSQDQRMPLSLESLEISNLASSRFISNLGTLTSLKRLEISDSNLNSISDLGSLVSLKRFWIYDCPNIRSIAGVGSHYSLEELHINGCRQLKSVACLRNLTSLQTLDLSYCPKLKSLPSPPPSLLELEIYRCPLLKKHWRRGKGKYSSKIAHIPKVLIDGKFIFNSKEEESSDSE